MAISLNDLQTPTQVSKSPIWDLLSQFYDERGIDAWDEHNIPLWGASNPVIGHLYARILIAFIQDQRRLSPNENGPFYIIELGAGAGQFTYYVLKEFQQLKSLHLPDIDVRYIATDIALSNLKYCFNHSKLKPFISSGLLDVATFNPLSDTSLKLKFSKKVLKSGSIKTPIQVISNYVFDSLPIDTFSVKHDQLYENLMSIHPKSKADSPSTSSFAFNLEQCRFQFSEERCKMPYYKNKEINSLLEVYPAFFRNTTFEFPLGALQSLQTLRTLSNDRLLVIAADKAACFSHEFKLRAPHPPLIHGPHAFSFQANFHALDLYSRELGGYAKHYPDSDSKLDISIFSIGFLESELPSTNHAYENGIYGFGPITFIRLLEELETQIARKDMSVNMPFCYQMLTMSRFDPFIFQMLAPFIERDIDSLDDSHIQQWIHALERVWDNYFHIGKTSAVPIELARLSTLLGAFHRALKWYDYAIDHGDERAYMHHNKGMCYYFLGHKKQALDCFTTALVLDPDHTKAQKWSQRLQREIKAEEMRKSS